MSFPTANADLVFVQIASEVAERKATVKRDFSDFRKAAYLRDLRLTPRSCGGGKKQIGSQNEATSGFFFLIFS